MIEFGVQWSLVLFSLLAGIGGLLYACAGLSEFIGTSAKRVRIIATVISLVLLVVGGLFSITHLALPENVMAAITNIWSFSGISIELLLLGCTFVFGLIYLILVVRDVNKIVLRIFGIIGIIFGLLLAFFCGHGYVMEGRPDWDTNLLPLAYLGTALGSASLIFGAIQLKGGYTPEQAASFRGVHLFSAIVLAVTAVLYICVVMIAGSLAEDAVIYAVLTIICAVVALIFSIVYFVKPLMKGNFWILVIGAIAAVATGLLIRMFMWGVSSGYLELFNMAISTRTIMP